MKNGILESRGGRRLIHYRLRLTIGVVFMFDALRRLIGGESRPVDLWVIVIELLVLAIILADSVLDKAHKFQEWRKAKSEFARVRERLAGYPCPSEPPSE